MLLQTAWAARGSCHVQLCRCKLHMVPSKVMPVARIAATVFTELAIYPMHTQHNLGWPTGGPLRSPYPDETQSVCPHLRTPPLAGYGILGGSRAGSEDREGLVNFHLSNVQGSRDGEQTSDFVGTPNAHRLFVNLDLN